jgi:hypothetical protein
MVSPSYPAAQAVALPPRNDSNDLSTWALIAVVVAIFAGVAGYIVASVNTPSWNDVATTSSSEFRMQQMRGNTDGFQKGRKAGAREAKMQGKLDVARRQRSSFNSGYQTGFDSGRDEALAARWGEPIPWSGTADNGGYPEFGSEDLFSTDGSSVFDDVPGYSTSSLSTSPYGGGANLSGGYTDWYRGGTSPVGY